MLWSAHNACMNGFASGSVATPIHIVKQAPRIVLRAWRSWSGPFEPVYVKVLPVNARSIEAVCAWLAREIELPVPEPMLLDMPASRLPKGCAWPFGTDPYATCFATRAVENALSLSNVSSDVATAMIDKWGSLPAAAAFDQLIANDDRTEGNILLGPRRDLWLIDHGRSLGGGGQRFFSTDVTPSTANFLLSRVARYPAQERVRLRPALIAVCTRLASAVSRVPYAALLVPEDIAMQIDDFLSRRVGMLQAMVLQSIGLPDLYDDGQHPSAMQ
jgi:hypothetical protein